MALERSAIGWQQYISRALGCKPGQLTYQLEECIEKIEALNPRTVNSATELDALPNMTVVMDNCDDVSQKRGGQWCGYETADLTSKQIAKYGPLTVLFTPGEAG